MKTLSFLMKIDFVKEHWKTLLAVVFSVIIFVLSLPVAVLTLFMPSVDENMYMEYRELAELTNLDLAELIVYDVVTNDNDLTNVDAENTAYEFITIEVKEYEREEDIDSEGNVYYNYVLVDTKKGRGKRSILDILDDLGYNSNRLKIDDILSIFESLDNSNYYDVNIIRHDIIDMLEGDEEKLEWAEGILSSNAVYEMYGLIDLPDNIPVPTNSFFAWPTPELHTVTSPFGYRTHPTTKEYSLHHGVDISGANAHGSPIIASADGEILQVNYSTGSSGYNIRIRHIDEDGNEWQTRYCHMSVMTVEVGNIVKQGDVIGAVGNTGRSTGPHLHFEMKFEGQLIDGLPYIR